MFRALALVSAVRALSRRSPFVAVQAIRLASGRRSRLSVPETEEEPTVDNDDWFEGNAVPETLQGCVVHIPREFHSVMTEWRKDRMAPPQADRVVPRAASPLRPREGLKPTTRQLRVGELIQQLLSKELALGSVRDARLKLVRVVEVRVTRDMQFAHVYWDEEGPDSPYTSAVLQGAAGMLRSALARQMVMRRVPALLFRRDPVPARLAQFDAALAEMEQQHAAPVPSLGPGLDAPKRRRGRPPRNRAVSDSAKAES